MTTPDPRAARRAILAILLAGLLYAGMGACVKAVADELPLAQVVLGRNLFALPVLLPLLLRGGRKGLAMRAPALHAQRLLWGFIGMATAFHGYRYLPLTTVTALGFTMPLILALLAVPLLGERMDKARALCAVAGFGGVLLMVRPGEGGALAPALVVLAGAFAWAMAMITIRRMGAGGESGVAIVFWFSLGCALVALVWSLPGWVWPTGRQWGLLALVGAVAALAQMLMTDAYRSADPTLVAPFEYSAIIWTTALGALLWADWPDGWDLLGVAVLIGAGLLLWRREAALRR